MSVCEKVTALAAVRAALPKRPADANKATFGRVLLVCGSEAAALEAAALLAKA